MSARDSGSKGAGGEGMRRPIQWTNGIADAIRDPARHNHLRSTIRSC
jgi:hypothetical protein